MPALALQRCFHHTEREAIARCPECTRYFCRECVAEHDERVICAECLQRLAAPSAERRPRRTLRLGAAVPVLLAVAGTLVGWFAFYFLGSSLVALPSEFHAQGIWRQLSGAAEFAAPPPTSRSP